MNLSINFDAHSFYKGFAIYDNRDYTLQIQVLGPISRYKWHAFTDNGNTYRIDELKAETLRELKQLITEYRSK